MDADEPATGTSLKFIVGFLVLRSGRIPINLFEELVLLMLIKLRKTKPRFYSSGDEVSYRSRDDQGAAEYGLPGSHGP